MLDTRSLAVEKIPAAAGKEFIKKWHYSHGIHNGPITYGLLRDDTLLGVCAFATPCSENVRGSVFGPARKNEVTELHRLAILDGEPTNTASFFVARAMRLLKESRPHLAVAISFADQTEGHQGVIYQALNARYCGTSGKTTFYRDADGRLRHPRQNGVNISRKVATERGWVPERRDGKHRYLLILPTSRTAKRQIERDILLPSLPYPA